MNRICSSESLSCLRKWRSRERTPHNRSFTHSSRFNCNVCRVRTPSRSLTTGIICARKTCEQGDLHTVVFSIPVASPACIVRARLSASEKLSQILLNRPSLTHADVNERMYDDRFFFSGSEKTTDACTRADDTRYVRPCNIPKPADVIFRRCQRTRGVPIGLDRVNIAINGIMIVHAASACVRARLGVSMNERMESLA